MFRLRYKRVHWRAAALVGLVVIAGCSSSTSLAKSASGSSSIGSDAASATKEVAVAPDAGPSTDAIPTGSNPGGYGQDSKTPTLYHGAGGFTLDVSNCPSDWSNTEGITDKEIKLFTAMPLSGPIAPVGVYGLGVKAYMDYVSANGGIGGRKITLDVNDNQYKPDVTKTIADKALQSRQYAASTSINGTPMNLAIWDSMNAECVPQLLNASGAAEWGDVQAHPWTTPGSTFSYVAESTLQVEWLKKEFPSGATVATITINNDFGKQYLSGLKTATKNTNIKIISSKFHDPSAPNLDNEVTSVASSNADVLILESSGVFCTQTLAAVGRSSWKPRIILPTGCIATTTFKPLIAQGLTGDGAYVIQTSLQITDPAVKDQPFVKAYKEFLPTENLNPDNTNYSGGWAYGWATAKILQDASTYKGGLNRANMVLAARAFNVNVPLLIPGLTTRTNGTKDAYMIEGGQMVQYKVSDPKATGSYVKAGELINIEGKLGTFKNFAAGLAAG